MTAPVQSAPVQGEPAQRAPTLTDILRDRYARIAPFVPPDMDIERVLQTAWVQTKRTPELLRCTPESILLAIVRIYVWGLEVGETAYLVPFKTTCTPVAAATGLVELAVASGVVKAAEAHCVYEKELDTFRMRRGLDPILTHYPMREPEAERGPIVGAYSIFWLRGGGAVWEYMAYADVDKLRRQFSKQWGKLETTPPWYLKKTVLRHGVKYIPKNPKLARLLAVVNEDSSFEDVADEEVPGQGGATLEQALAGGAPPLQLAAGAAPMQPVPVPQAAAAPAPVDLGPPPARPAAGPKPLATPPSDNPYGDAPSAPPASEPAPPPAAPLPPAPSAPEPAPSAPAPAPAAPSAPAPASAAQVAALDPPCPVCGGRMWDNRNNKKNPKAPDFKCRSGNCEGVYWPGQADKLLVAQPATPVGAPVPLPPPVEETFPNALVDETDDLPF